MLSNFTFTKEVQPILDNDMWLPMRALSSRTLSETTRQRSIHPQVFGAELPGVGWSLSQGGGEFVFVKLLLSSSRLSDETKNVLEKLGADALEQGKSGEAFAVIPHDARFFEELRWVVGVVGVEFGERVFYK